MSEQAKAPVKKDEGLRVKNTPHFKLKDKPNRQYVLINFKKQFGFNPENVIIEKIRGENNTLIFRAVLTDEETKKEDKLLAEQAKLTVQKEKKDGKSK